MIKRSVSLVITHAAEPDHVLLVLRPHDDAELPDVWGLPAATLADGETWADAARRTGRDKLGVELDIGDVLEHGNRRRNAYRLDMRLVHALIRTGTPSVPQPVPGVTQYQNLRWGPISDLGPAAGRGSLCAHLCLVWHRRVVT